MFEETAPHRSGLFRSIILIAFFGFVLLSLPQWLSPYETLFNLPFAVSIYQLLVFLSMAILIFRFIRHYALEYRYVIADGTVTIYEKIGARENIVFSAAISADSQIIKFADGGELLREKGYHVRRFSFGVADKKHAYIATFPANKANSFAIFQPSEQFVKILQQIALDKRAEM